MLSQGQRPLLTLSLMSIYLEGNIVPSVGFSLEARTLVSTTFARSLRLPQTNRLLLTTAFPVYGTFSTLVQVEITGDHTHDVRLGHDWSSFLRESLILSLVPVLKIGPLRRLLDLHDVAYAETDKIKCLRRRLKTFLYQLVTGKPSSEHPAGTWRGDRSRMEARLSMQWPQLVPDHLKKRLLANFNLGLSPRTLSFFVCGSCAERLPETESTTLLFSHLEGPRTVHWCDR
jgi:hypothetical protein